MFTAKDGLSYSYLANDSKREKVFGKETTHYRGSVVYNDDGTPDYVLHPEGMAKHLGNNQWQWHYLLRD